MMTTTMIVICEVIEVCVMVEVQHSDQCKVQDDHPTTHVPIGRPAWVGESHVDSI